MCVIIKRRIRRYGSTLNGILALFLLVDHICSFFLKSNVVFNLMYVKTKYLKEFLFFQMFNIRLDSFFLTSKKLVTDRRFGGRHRFF